MEDIDLTKYIRSVPNFPKKGIIFKDITTLLKEPVPLKATLRKLFEFTQNKSITKVVGIESRGFIFGAMLAERLDVGFVPVRKPGKLPWETVKESYALEYGEDTIEIHKDAIQPGDKILIHDDLLATGGTARATANLIKKLKAEVVQLSFIIELSFLKGREQLKEYDVRTVVDFKGE
jgi:adenine phosphoribosyltransferase